jgi:hypothetical protein
MAPQQPEDIAFAVGSDESDRPVRGKAGMPDIVDVREPMQQGTRLEIPPT